MSSPRRKLDPLERFWSHVLKTDTCWLWTAHRNHNGYGVFGLTSKKSVLAHRWIYSQLVEPVEDYLRVLHRDDLCTSRACVRLDHLYKDTCADNVRDRVRAGKRTGPRSENAQHAKLTWEAVAEIREQHASEGTATLAKKFGVYKTTIRDIVYYRTWRENAKTS